MLELREHGIDALLRQVLHEVGEVLRLHLLADRDELRLFEQPHERRANRRRELEQHGSAPLAADQEPGRDALLLAHALEHERGVGRVQAIQLLFELDGVLPLHERLHERVLARIGARHELVHERLAFEQRDDAFQRRVEILVMFTFAAHEPLPTTDRLASRLVYSLQRYAEGRCSSITTRAKSRCSRWRTRTIRNVATITRPTTSPHQSPTAP